MHARFTFSFLAACLALFGCSNTPAAVDAANPGSDAGNDAGRDAGNDAASAMTDAGNDAAASATDSGCAGTVLTVLNYDLWCSVAVNGGAASTAASQTVCVPASTNVALVATAVSGFQLGNWHHTTGDTGSGDPGTVSGGMSTAHYMSGTASAGACIWVCCPFPGGAGCPTTEQCP